MVGFGSFSEGTPAPRRRARWPPPRACRWRSSGCAAAGPVGRSACTERDARYAPRLTPNNSRERLVAGLGSVCVLQPHAHAEEVGQPRVDQRLVDQACRRRKALAPERVDGDARFTTGGARIRKGGVPSCSALAPCWPAITCTMHRCDTRPGLGQVTGPRSSCSRCPSPP